MKPYSFLSYSLHNAIARITFTRPSVLNALSPKVGLELSDALEKAVDEGARAVVLAGEGRAFSAGGDLTEGLPDTVEGAREGLLALQRPIRRIAGLPIPVIASVQGAVAGGGVAVALAADMVVATRTAYFMLAFVHIGLAPEMGAAWLFAKSVGRARALEAALLGDRISAQTALEWGLITRVVDEHALGAETDLIAGRLAKGPPLALKAIREQIDQALGGTLEDVLALEEKVTPMLVTSLDCQEGFSAFKARRSAKFEGA